MNTLFKNEEAPERSADAKAEAFAERINILMGIDSCRWCRMSRAYFAIVPVHMTLVARMIRQLFEQAGCARVTYSREAGSLEAGIDGLQVSGYLVA
ncbi:hypothetical protein [Cupriavidus sp. D39]|uniref:hypothetical protein n=1 Tax=Cupriavidus sp. D39 TaxID=2997877 RepID=UPI00226E41A3|nr:hypothetical protein [Cupriavidus sp. D39]MCY0853011.1 hypothetical protein [Cupriavidus sp. D39]